MAQQLGGVGKGLQQVLSGVVITYVVAIGVTFLMLILAIIVQDMFPAMPNPFFMIYSIVRGITLFMLLFPIAAGLIITSFLLDTVIEIAFPALNGFFEVLQFPITLPETSDFVGTATTILDSLRVFIESIFPAQIGGV